MLLHTSYLYLMEENKKFVKQVFLMLIQKKIQINLRYSLMVAYPSNDRVFNY